MEIRLARTAGFCFGVDRAVQLTRRLLDQGEKVATLGPLIHNPQVVADLARRGALVADSPQQVPPGYKVVIRSHGVPRSVYDQLQALGLPWQDATCPFVAKIHAIARGGRTGGRVPGRGRGQRPSRGAGDRGTYPRGSPSSLPIWPSCGPGKGLKIPKNGCLWLLRPHFKQQNGKNVRSF